MSENLFDCPNRTENHKKIG